MVMFKTAATDQLRLLWISSLIANSFRVLPTDPDTNCGSEVYQRVIVTLEFNVLTAIAATVLLLAARLAVCAVEFNAVAAALAVHDGVKAFDLHHEAAAAAAGVGSIATKWRRVSLRGTLVLAVVLSAASDLLAVMTWEYGFAYWIGCDTGYGVPSPLGVFMMATIVFVHGSSAWVAVSEN